MIRIAYCSSAAQPEVALLTLADIISVSDRNNRRDRLTGALLVSRGRFFQVLEGAPSDVERTLRRIAVDPRHTDIKPVFREEVRARLFADWNMVAARVSPDLTAEIDDTIDACEDDPRSAIAAVHRLVLRQRDA